MIARLTSAQLRKLADQVDAYTALAHAGADHPAPNTVLQVDGVALAYLAWWEDQRQHLAEFISFTPGDAPPLVWHGRAAARTER
jgi:hypothetical protein